MKRIAILGSTGSIGTNTLKVARHLSDEIQVTALAAGSNVDLLCSQAKEFNPEIVAVYNEDKARELQGKLPGVRVVAGMEGLSEAASHESVDMVVAAITGTAGLVPTVAAIEAGKDIALANKETLVSGGELVMRLVKEKGVSLLPVDSEHSAIFQCLNGEDKASVHRILLTASGGPFRQHSTEQLGGVTVDDALNHPTWAMGPKVTVDSSTLMNKGLEVIEAYWLFGVTPEQIDVVVHPQSIIHSMVEFVDGSVIAQAGETTMCTPIQYALTYPHRLPGTLKPFDWLKTNTLQFFPPDTDKFPCLRLAFDAINSGDSLPCYMNAANEILVGRFLNKELGWQDIATKLEALMGRHKAVEVNSLEDILAVDQEARLEATT